MRDFRLNLLNMVDVLERVLAIKTMQPKSISTIIHSTIHENCSNSVHFCQCILGLYVLRIKLEDMLVVEARSGIVLQMPVEPRHKEE
mgnify:CR=1 FL=1|jgi:hypothetical protein